MGGVWGGGAPQRAGVRNALDSAADRAMTSRTAEVAYLTSQLVTGLIVEALLWVGRRLPR